MRVIVASYKDLLLDSSSKAGEGWDGMVLKQAELQNKMAVLRQQEELERKNKYKLVLNEQRQEVARTKTKLKQLQHSA